MELIPGENPGRECVGGEGAHGSKSREPQVQVATGLENSCGAGSKLGLLHCPG